MFLAQSVSRAVKEILSNLAYLSFAFQHQLVNESALARFIHPRVEEKTGAPVSRGAVIAAVRRFTISFKPRHKDLKLMQFLKSFKIQLRTGLSEANFMRTKKTAAVLAEHSAKTQWDKVEEFYVLNRPNEITLITPHAQLKAMLSRIPQKDVLSRYDDRAIITVFYDPELEEKTFGALYYLADIFASLGVIVHVVFSTYSANSFVIKEKDVPFVYHALSESMREIDALHEE